MSRFADPDARTTVPLGPCECPGSPHDSDWAVLRSELSSSDVRRAIALDGLDDAGVAEGLVEFLPEWNLLGPKGEAWPPSGESILALKMPTLKLLIGGLAKAVAESSSVPNLSSVPSPGSSRGNASSTPKRNRTPGT
jgi:hypothetical protein